MKTIYYIPTVMLLVCCITMSINQSELRKKKKMKYINQLNTKRFHDLQSWIEKNINIGETKSDFYHVRVDSKHMLLQPRADRELNDETKDLKERIYLGNYYICQPCEDRRTDGENVVAIFPPKLYKDYDVFDHLSEYHSSLIDNMTFD